MGTKEIVVPPAEVVRAALENLPPLIADAGELDGGRFSEFFTANIRNKNTRSAYARRREFFDWCGR
jgi:hypothetical protein